MKKINHASRFCFLSEVLYTNSNIQTFKRCHIVQSRYGVLLIPKTWLTKSHAAMGPVHISFVDREGHQEGNKWRYVLIFTRCDSLHLNSPHFPPQADTYSRTRSARSYEFPFPKPTSPLPHHFLLPPPHTEWGVEETRLPGHFLKTSWRDKKW